MTYLCYTWLSILSTEIETFIAFTFYSFYQLNKMWKLVNQVGCFPNSQFCKLKQTPGTSLTGCTTKTHWKRVIRVVDVLVVMCAQSYPCWNTRLNSRSFVYFLNTTFTSSDRWTGPVKSSLPVWVRWLYSIQSLGSQLVLEGFIGLILVSGSQFELEV